MASEPGAGKTCNGEPAADMTPSPIAAIRSSMPKAFQRWSTVLCRAGSRASQSSGSATTPVMMSPQPAECGNGPDNRPSAASIRNSDGEDAPDIEADQQRQGQAEHRPARRRPGGGDARRRRSGATTKIPMIGKGRAVAAQPAALPAAAMPTHRPSRAASHSLAPRTLP